MTIQQKLQKIREEIKKNQEESGKRLWLEEWILQLVDIIDEIKSKEPDNSSGSSS